MVDSGGWLSAAGFDWLVPVFEREGLDLDIVQTLSDEDLVRLGVAKLGDRRRLLSAIAELAPSPSAAPVERRLVSVLFCDLVGSTALSVRHDAEDLRQLLRRYLDTTVRAIERHGGHVGQVLGDGVLAYFGWPRACMRTRPYERRERA